MHDDGGKTSSGFNQTLGLQTGVSVTRRASTVKCRIGKLHDSRIETANHDDFRSYPSLGSTS
jgi:hypothetical protein